MWRSLAGAQKLPKEDRSTAISPSRTMEAVSAIDACDAVVARDVSEGTLGVDTAAGDGAPPTPDATPVEPVRLVWGAAIDPMLPPLQITIGFDTGVKKKFVLPPAAMTEDLKALLEKTTGVVAGVSPWLLLSCPQLRCFVAS